MVRLSDNTYVFRKKLIHTVGSHQEEVTVHLLGGANMSSDGTGQGGVTNQIGEVFTGHGSEIYEGLICCDASVVPTSLGKLDSKLLQMPRLNMTRCKSASDDRCSL
jgi:hypothetical protein